MRLGQILRVLGVVKGVHRLTLLPSLRLHFSRMGLVGLGLMWWSRRVSLTLLPCCGSRCLVKSLPKLPRSHGLASVGIDVSISPLAHPRPHASILGLIARVLGTPKSPQTLLLLVGVWRLSRGRVRIPGCVANIGITLGLWLWLWVSHLAPTHSNMTQVVRWVLRRGRCYALWRVVLVYTSCIGCWRILHAPITALRHLVSSHLVGAGPWLCGRLLIGCSALLLAPNSNPTTSSPSLTWVPMVWVVGVSWVVMVMGRHAIHGTVHVWWPLVWTILGHHASSLGTGLIIASIGAVVVHLTQFRLSWAGPCTVEHSLVIASVSLVLVV